jgi:hypothetical protein
VFRGGRLDFCFWKLGKTAAARFSRSLKVLASSYCIRWLKVEVEELGSEVSMYSSMVDLTSVSR